MDIADIALRTNLSTRKLRYVFDHKLLPGLKGPGEGRGVSRHLSPFESFGVALAAVLLEAGVKRRLVEACIERLACAEFTVRTQNNCLLMWAFLAKSASLQLGDGSYYRVECVQQNDHQVATTWASLLTKKIPSTDYRPLVTVLVDLGRLSSEINS